jgi:hypothetical protein
MARVCEQNPSPQSGRLHDLVAIGPAEPGHDVEDIARQLSLELLPSEGATSHTSADDSLVSVHGVFDQAALTNLIS